MAIMAKLFSKNCGLLLKYNKLVIKISHSSKILQHFKKLLKTGNYLQYTHMTQSTFFKNSNRTGIYQNQMESIRTIDGPTNLIVISSPVGESINLVL